MLLSLLISVLWLENNSEVLIEYNEPGHAFCIWEKEGADQLHGSCAADQCLLF